MNLKGMCEKQGTGEPDSDPWISEQKDSGLLEFC